MPKYQVAVEIEGGIWTKGRHVTGIGYQKDCEKYNHAILCGWTVFRLTSDMVNAQWVEIIKTYLKGCK